MTLEKRKNAMVKSLKSRSQKVDAEIVKGLPGGEWFV
jgi:hypothetical protein